MLTEHQMNIVKALIDTVENTTDMLNVYDDKNSTSFSWKEVYDAFDIPEHLRMKES